MEPRHHGMEHQAAVRLRPRLMRPGTPALDTLPPVNADIRPEPPFDDKPNVDRPSTPKRFFAINRKPQSDRPLGSLALAAKGWAQGTAMSKPDEATSALDRIAEMLRMFCPSDRQVDDIKSGSNSGNHLVDDLMHYCGFFVNLIDKKIVCGDEYEQTKSIALHTLVEMVACMKIVACVRCGGKEIQS